MMKSSSLRSLTRNFMISWSGSGSCGANSPFLVPVSLWIIRGFFVVDIRLVFCELTTGVATLKVINKSLYMNVYQIRMSFKTERLPKRNGYLIIPELFSNWNACQIGTYIKSERISNRNVYKI